jgi:hypothetical protein
MGAWKKFNAVVPHVIEAHRQCFGDKHHSDLELSILEADWSTSPDFPALVARAKACLNAHDADLAHRLVAGSWLMVFADNTGDTTLAEEVYRVSSRLFQRDERAHPAECRIRLIYHCTLGDNMEAQSAARELIQRERLAGTPGSLCRALRQAAVVCRYVAQRSSALVLLDEAAILARRFQLPHAAFTTLDQQAAIALEEGELARAKSLVALAEQWAPKIDDPMVLDSLRSTKTQMALFEGQFDLAEKTIRECHDRAQGELFSRRVVAMKAMWLCVQLRSPSAKIEGLLQDVLEGHARIRRLGHQDFIVIAIVKSLRALGQADRALQFLENYLHCDRREVSQAHLFLLREREELCIPAAG